jgi:hypothetical protein
VEEFKQWWRDAINAGATFLLDEEDIFRGWQFGEPYLYVRLVTEEESGGAPFSDVARRLYALGTGAMVCRRGWSPDQTHNVDCLWVSYGDVVDFLFNGEMKEREPATLGWGPPVDQEDLHIKPPGQHILAGHQRFVLNQAMQVMGVGDTRVALVIDRLGTRSITFNLHAYIEDEEQAMNASAFINWFLPRYYLQTVYTNDYDVATFPVLPSEADIAEDNFSPPRDNNDTWYDFHRRSARTAALLAADAIPRVGERRWRERAVAPETRFHFDIADMITAHLGAPHLVLRVATGAEDEANTQTYTLSEAALAAVDLLHGAILCDQDWSLDRESEMDLMEAEDARLFLRLGDLVDYLMTGELIRRGFASDGWLYPMEYYSGRFSEPDLVLLPLACRHAIITAMQQAGISDHRVALQTLDNGRRLLHFSGHEVVGWDPELRGTLLSRIHWCLPRHYTPFLLDSPTYLAWDLQPSSAVPDSQVFDLDADKDEEWDEDEEDKDETEDEAE